MFYMLVESAIPHYLAITRFTLQWQTAVCCISVKLGIFSQFLPECAIFTVLQVCSRSTVTTVCPSVRPSVKCVNCDETKAPSEKVQL